MQVAHVAEPDSHVIIGGGVTRAFQVTASAAAFKIMSDSLYRDKERAAVREIVCNAIDAHAMNGNEAVPVRVRLTDDELVVEDDGPGIHDEKIADIYCTLFASTKLGQDNQTGGFGLGSKAPFAISDHFTVSSRHDGVMSLYAMHVGDPATNGTPGAKRMMQTRCDGSGLTVSVPLAGAPMREKIEKALREIVSEGGMLVTLNGDKLDAPDYTELKRNGYGMRPRIRYGETKIQVLYANVLYPMDMHDELVPFVQKLQTFTLNQMNLLLYAPPSSISVTPSREALSYNDVTVATLKELLRKLVGQIQTLARPFLKEEMKKAFAHIDRENLPIQRVQIPHAERQETVTTGAEGIARAWARHQIDTGRYTARDQARYVLTLPKVKRKRELRQMASAKFGRRFSFEAQHAKLTHRQFARILVAGDATAFAFERLSEDDKLASLSNPPERNRWRYHYRNGFKRVVHVAEHRDLVKKGKAGYYIVSAKLKPDQIARIKAKAEAFGWGFEHTRKTAKVVKPKPREMFGPPCPPRYREVRFNPYSDRDEHGFDRTVHSTELKSYQTGKFDHPVAWFGLKGTTIQFKPGFKSVRVPNGDEALELIRKHIGRTVMVHTRGEVDNLLAGNVRRLEEIILEKLRARVKKGHDYEAFYAQIAFAAGVTDKSTRQHRDLNINPIAREMMIHSRRFAHAALREPYKVSKDRDEAWAFWMMARTVFHDRWVEGPHIDKAECDVIDKLVEEYRELAMPLEARQFGAKPAWESTQHLSLFDNFRNTSFGSLTHDEREDFLEFAETLGRRYISRQEKKGKSK